MLQRLPANFNPKAQFVEASERKLHYGDPDSTSVSHAQFTRPEGSFAARSFGNVVHACLEILSNRVLNGSQPAELLAELPSWTSRITAMLRSDGLPRTTVQHYTRETSAALRNTLHDPNGLWLLAPQSRSHSEFALTAWQDSRASIRIDRIFQAGPEPHTPGKDFLWIVDYKTTAHGPAGLEDFLATQRTANGTQLETYARILAPARSMPLTKVRVALYFPTIPRLDWWIAASTSD